MLFLYTSVTQEHETDVLKLRCVKWQLEYTHWCDCLLWVCESAPANRRINTLHLQICLKRTEHIPQANTGVLSASTVNPIGLDNSVKLLEEPWVNTSASLLYPACLVSDTLSYPQIILFGSAFSTSLITYIVTRSRAVQTPSPSTSCHPDSYPKQFVSRRNTDLHFHWALTAPIISRRAW